MTTVDDLTAHTDGTAQPAPPTSAELIAHAIALRPKLLARQQETEELGRYPEATHQDFLDTGLYRIVQPRLFGGYESDIATLLDVTIELARGCPSTAWGYAFAVTNQLIASMICTPRAQQELNADGPPLLANTAVPSPQRAEKVDGGHRIRGTYPYASGSPYSTHFMGTALSPDGTPMMFIAPRADYTLNDDWGDVLGLRGSGSNSITVDSIVPDHLILHQTIKSLEVHGTSAGYQQHHNPMYALPTGSALSASVIISVAIGAAWGALDEYQRTMYTRTAYFTANPDGTSTPPIRSTVEEFQVHLGAATGKLHAAHAIIIRGGQLMTHYAQRNIDENGFDYLWDNTIVAMALGAIDQAWSTVQNPLATTIGTTNIIRADERMQRYIRDIQTIYSHRVINYRHRNSLSLGQALLTTPPATPA